ncbi:ABC transporter permease [Saccharopolyspora cebuensis]|uniref:FtsX-like permease family protein n=1 Tax=Saccharopolyspora cebuensis TaxID=418759 RepID=A0ABV4CI18_9PSEU
MNPVQLALRVLRKDSRTRLSAVLTAVGVAVATALVLFMASIPNATDARQERSAWQHGGIGADGAVTIAGIDFFQGEKIVRLDVAGRPAPEPNAPPEFPAAGEVLLSPALAEHIAEHPEEQLGDRFPGEVIGELAPESLKFPEQLVAVVGHPEGVLSPDPDELGHVANNSADLLLPLLAGVGIVLLTVPSLVLVASASRLAAARRERRLAALRLAGATPKQVVAAVIAETALAAVVGTAVGAVLSLPLRHLGAQIPWSGGTWYVSDFTPPGTALAAVMIGIPLLVVVAAGLGLRRVVRAPVSAAMEHRRARPSAWRLLSLVAVGALFAFSLAQANGGGGFGMLLAALAAIVLSASIVGPWVTGMLGRTLTRAWQRPALLLAGRRLRSDPQAAYRSVSGVVLAAFVGSMALTLLPGFETLSGGGRSYANSALYVEVSSEEADEHLRRLTEGLSASGTEAITAKSQRVVLTTPNGATASGLVMDCASAAEITRLRIDDCGGPPAVRLDGSAMPNSTELALMSEEEGGSDVPLTPGEVRPLGDQGDDISVSALIDPALVPAAGAPAETELVIETPTAADREQARTVISQVMPGVVADSRDLTLNEQQTMLGDLRRVTTVGLSLIALLTGASAAITAASSVFDRRKTFAALIAAGTPVRLLGRALRTEAALPALVATVGAGAGGVAVAFGLLSLFGAGSVFTPWAFAPAVLGVAVALLASAVSGPMLRKVSAEGLSEE